MKKLILFLSIPFSLHAQSDSLKVTFSEEKVEQFEKTTLIDEYERAFGGNREVKSGLRVRISDPQNISGLLFQYEQKIGRQYSLIGTLSGGYGSLKGFQFKIHGEARWYYKMMKRVVENKQKANLTGSFISIRGSHQSSGSSIQPSVRVTSSNSFMSGSSLNPIFLYKSSLSLLWGKQLGNNLEFGFIGGVNHGNEFFNKNVNFMLNTTQTLEPLEVKTKIVPYFSTFSQVGIGVFYPRKSKLGNNKCEFLKCNYIVNRLFKLNINDAIYLDKYVQKVKVDAGIEQRIGNSNFSFNADFTLGLSSFRNLEVQSFKDTLIFFKEANKDLQVFFPLYSGKTINDITLNFSHSSQIRYYLTSKSKNIRNFNGVYTGVEYGLRYNKFTEQINPYKITRSSNVVSSLSGILGYQTQTSLGSFMDFTVALGVEEIKNNYTKESIIIGSNGNFRHAHFELSIKLGLAK